MPDLITVVGTGVGLGSASGTNGAESRSVSIPLTAVAGDLILCKWYGNTSFGAGSGYVPAIAGSATTFGRGSIDYDTSLWYGVWDGLGTQVSWTLSKYAMFTMVVLHLDDTGGTWDVYAEDQVPLITGQDLSGGSTDGYVCPGTADETDNRTLYDGDWTGSGLTGAQMRLLFGREAMTCTNKGAYGSWFFSDDTAVVQAWDLHLHAGITAAAAGWTAGSDSGILEYDLNGLSPVANNAIGQWEWQQRVWTRYGGVVLTGGSPPTQASQAWSADMTSGSYGKYTDPIHSNPAHSFHTVAMYAVSVNLHQDTVVWQPSAPTATVTDEPSGQVQKYDPVTLDGSASTANSGTITYKGWYIQGPNDDDYTLVSNDETYEYTPVETGLYNFFYLVENSWGPNTVDPLEDSYTDSYSGSFESTVLERSPNPRRNVRPRRFRAHQLPHDIRRIR